MNYVSLHSHSYYSQLDGAASPKEYLERAKELGMPALAITDHGTMSGHREALVASQETDMKVILGMEGYITEDRFDVRSKKKRQDGTSVYNHVTLLAQNQRGLETLGRLSKAAWTEGYYYKPRMDTDLLFNDNEGVIVASGCMSGMVSAAILNDDMDRAVQIASSFKEALGDRYYIEVMATNSIVAPGLNQKLLAIADKLGIKPIMTSDCHYLRKEDLPTEQALLILASSPKKNMDADLSKAAKMDMLDRLDYLYPERTMDFRNIEVYLRDYKTEKQLFVEQGIERDDIFENTLEIADRVTGYTYYENLDLLPVPKNGKPRDILRRLVYKGLKSLGLDDKPEYVERVEHELEVIGDKNFDVYFIILADALQWARNRGIMVGPGRGSGAGSLVNYCLGITRVDPIKYNLLFMRFLDPSRDDWPDIDVDIEDLRRGEVRNYLEQKYGHVSGLATIVRFHGKSSIRDAARVLRIPLADVNKALKNNDAPPDINDSEEYYNWFLNTDKGAAFHKAHPDVVPMARSFYDKIKTFGQHASGIIISKEPIDKYVSIETAKKPKSKEERQQIAAIDMEDAARLGAIKLDMLGLKTLRIIADSLKLIKEQHGVDIDLESLPLDDPKVYELISDLRTRGIFQLDKPAYTRLIRDMGGVHTFDELAASNALVRPGAMDTIGPQYVLRKQGKAPVKYLHPDIIPFTEDTYGLPTLYQEQVMFVMTEIAGMSMQQANEVRRVVAKKKDVALLQKYRDEFIEGARQKITDAQANRLWKDIEAQAGYSFNKSHAVAYSILSYWTAWLKTHYPKEFLTCCMRAASNAAETTDFLIELRRMGVKVLLPHVNKSAVETQIEGDNVRMGLTTVKYLGAAAAKKIIAARPFKSYADLAAKAEQKHSGISVRVLESLNKVGAAAFEDNLPRGNERSNYYDILGIPHFENDVLPPRAEAQIIKTIDFEEEGIGFIRAIARKVENKGFWARVELLDESGALSLFCDPKADIVTGELYLVLAVDNRAFDFIPLNDVDQESALFRYLMNDIPTMSETQYYTVSWRDYTTKAGKDMAYLVAADHIGNLHHVIVFNSRIAAAKAISSNGKTWEARLKENEEGSLILGDYIG